MLPRRILPAAGIGPRPTIAAGGLAFKTATLSIDLCNRTGESSQGQSYQPIALADKATGLLGKHPAGNGLQKGGRNSPREYAQ